MHKAKERERECQDTLPEEMQESDEQPGSDIIIELMSRRGPSNLYDLRIQTHKRFKRTLFIRTKTQSANFRGNPLYQATKRHLNNS